uniref:Chain length factor n=1 Tax=Streptomyces sp. R1128 TaxID=140437 RepID=Q9F6E1_9ACTN|nr:chain length factor [Streptomyces sp. R1128]
MTQAAPTTRRAVVTGLGAVAPNGFGTEEYWKATLRGRSGIHPLHRYDASGFPSRLAGQILGFEAEQHIPGRLLPQTDRVTRLALVAGQSALDDAGVDPQALVDYSMGVVTSSAIGGFEFTHGEVHKLWTKGPQHVSVYESFAWFYAVNTGQLSIRHGMRGPSGVLVGEQAGGLDAIGHARRNLRRGIDLVVTGGCDSALDPWGYVSHLTTGRISRATEPELAYRPFDAAADGYVPGEGGAILVLEDERAARARGAATLYGEIAGYAATFDPPPGSERPPGLARAARLALDDAGVRPEDVDAVFADAAGVPDLDRAEAEAINEVFGAGAVPVTAPKSLVGRLNSGGPPLDVVAALLSIRDDVVPPTPNTTDVPADYGLDLVLSEPRNARVRTVLVLARGHGGFNAAVVVRAMNPEL